MTTQQFDLASAVAERLSSTRDVLLSERSSHILGHYQSEINRGCFGLAKARNPQLVLSRIIDRCIGDLRGSNHQPGREGL